MTMPRSDYAFYDADVVHAALTGGADVSITVLLHSKVKRRWRYRQRRLTTTTYPNPVRDQITGGAGVPVRGRQGRLRRVLLEEAGQAGRRLLSLARIPDANAARNQADGQGDRRLTLRLLTAWPRGRGVDRVVRADMWPRHHRSHLAQRRSGGGPGTHSGPVGNMITLFT